MLDRQTKVSREQLPIVEAFATKSQSVTLPRAVIDCESSFFKSGMAYVALSRVRKMEDLILLRFDQEKLFMKYAKVELEYIRLKCSPMPHEGNHLGIRFYSKPPSNLISSEEDNEEQIEAEEKGLLYSRRRK